MQALQRTAHRAAAKAAKGGRLAPSWAIGALAFASLAIRPLAARFIGIGLRPEHVRSVA